jgi:hypothetical protein
VNNIEVIPKVTLNDQFAFTGDPLSPCRAKVWHFPASPWVML